VHLIVATPGRILDLLNKRLIKTDDCKVLVLDEVMQLMSMMSICVVEVIANKYKWLLVSQTQYNYNYKTVLHNKKRNTNVTVISKHLMHWASL